MQEKGYKTQLTCFFQRETVQFINFAFYVFKNTKQKTSLQNNNLHQTPSTLKDCCLEKYECNSMDNLLNFSADDLEPYMFGSNQEEERKVHTPFVEPQDFSFDGDSSIKPICTKIQFTFDDYAVGKKAKSRKTKTVEDPNSNKKCGHWSSDENKRYHWFLEVHHQHFFNKHLRRTDRIFKSMANFVQTREAQQCRSHHQKMQKKYKYFSKILMSLRLQNYNSNDTDIILSDMSSKGHDISELSFLPAQQLRVISESTNQQQKQMFQIKTTPKARISKFQNSATTLASSCTHLQQACEEQNKQRQVEIFGAFLQRPDDIDDIFNDTYERNIDLGSFF